MDSPVQPWFKRAIAAWVFAASTAGFLFIVTFVPFVALLYAKGVRGIESYSFSCFPLAMAGLLFAVTAFLVPSLVAGNKTLFPLNFTLPTVYCALVLLSSQFMATVSPPIALIGESARIDQVWTRPDFLAAAWIVQVACMSFSTVRASRKPVDEP